MQHWPWVRELVFWGSLALNAVLFVFFFFKSAINEIAREWWIGRRQRKEEEQNRLYELRRHLVAYPSHHFSLMIQAVLSSRVQTDLELGQILKAVESAGRRLTEATEFTAANEPRFPPEIRDGLKKLKQVSLISDVLADHSRMLARHERVAGVCEQLVARIDALVRNNGS